VDKNGSNDLDSHRLAWTKAVNLAQNRPLWRLLTISGTAHSQWCMLKMTMMITKVLLWRLMGNQSWPW